MAVSVGLVAASVLLTLVGIELALRLKYPFVHSSWPCMTYRFGPAFRPGATVRWTNLRDFCVEQRANSLGFLDREPPEKISSEEFRILILGDSFVEAAQVRLDQKFQVLLEAGLRRAYPGRTFRVNAMGYSGSGTSDELAFYDRFKARFQPDLVIALFVNNDFANNSMLLEAVRYGFHPDHPPRPYFLRTGGAYHGVEVDPQWLSHRIDAVRPPAADPELSFVPGVIRDSTTYAWARARFRDGALTERPLMVDRIAWLRRNPSWEAELAGWRYPDDEDLDAMFFAEEMPPVFQNAVETTGHVLDEFLDRSSRDGFRFLLAAADNCSGPAPPIGRRLLPKGPLVRLRRLADDRGVEVVDLMEHFRREGYPEGSHFSRDGHWDPTGHRLASEAILEFLSSRADRYLSTVTQEDQAGRPGSREGRAATPSTASSPFEEAP